MSGFDDREKGFESKFAHDQQMEFKAVVRRNKLLGLWAAELMGHPDPEGYAKEVVKSDFEEAGDEDVYRKVAGDFEAKGVGQTEHQLRKKMADLLEDARAQVASEG